MYLNHDGKPQVILLDIHSTLFSQRYATVGVLCTVRQLMVCHFCVNSSHGASLLRPVAQIQVVTMTKTQQDTAQRLSRYYNRRGRQTSAPIRPTTSRCPGLIGWP